MVAFYETAHIHTYMRHIEHKKNGTVCSTLFFSGYLSHIYTTYIAHSVLPLSLTATPKFHPSPSLIFPVSQRRR